MPKTEDALEAVKQHKRTWMIPAIVAAVLLTATACFVIWYWGLNPVVRVESGDPLPEIEAIAPEGDSYLADSGTLPVGLHVVWVRHRTLSTPVLVWVRDTVAPSAEPKEMTIPYGTTVTPDQLIRNVKDANIVAVSFSEPFDFDRIGDFPVTVVLKDPSGNRNSVASVLHIRAAVEALSLEAGEPVPEADAFLLDGVEAECKTTLSESMSHHVGTYPVRFLLPNGQTAETVLTVSDTIPPAGEGTFLWIRPEDPLLPEQLVERAFDETTLQYAFVNEPDRTLMEVQSVTVRMTDEGGNTTDVVSSLAISRIAPTTVELSDEPLSESIFGEANIELIEPFTPNAAGLYTVLVTVNGEADYVLITVVDTTPPTIEQRTDTTLYTLHPVAAEAVFSAADLSPVTVSWIGEPDWTAAGEQMVRALAVDRYGNAAEAEGTISLQQDTEPPVLYGVVNRTAYVGEPIAYLKEVYAEDAVDGRVTVTVESEVDPDQTGTYTVVYTAEDLSGNSVSAKCKFKLVNATVSEEEVRTLAKEVLKEILTDDMVTAEKLLAVFNYVRGHVNYTGTSDKTDWRKEAVRGFKTGKGDCFTVYAVTRALLDELDVPYMSVTRKSSKTQHFWVIVNIGTGWYHYDPLVAGHHKHRCFMWTNRQCQVKPYFWRFEKSLYPEIATEPFDYDKVVEMERDGLLP